MKRLSDGTIGYNCRAADDCWCAAIATVLQVPIDELPYLRIDERLAAGDRPGDVTRDISEQIAQWLAARGLRMTVDTDVPLAADRWIGVIPVEGCFQSHCLVMTRGCVLWDPAQYLAPPEPTDWRSMLGHNLTEDLLDPIISHLLRDPVIARQHGPRCWTWGPDDVRAGYMFKSTLGRSAQ